MKGMESLTLHRIKILILHTVDGTPGPVPRHVIETALALCDANIFAIQEALHDLLKNENLSQKEDENGVSYLFLTEQGRCVIDALRKDVSPAYREKSLAYAAVEMTKLRTEIGINATVTGIGTEKNNEYRCDLSLSDDGQALFQLSLYSPNKLQADMMAERFRKHPLDVYRKVLQIMTGTDEPTED